MADIKDIVISGTYAAAGRNGNPSIPVRVVGVRGRWVKVKSLVDGVEFNAAAKDLTAIAEGEEVSAPKNGVIDPAARARYIRTRVDGVMHLDCGDEVAEKTRGMELEEVAKLASKILGAAAEALLQQYAHLNRGMAMMNIRNRMRKALRDAAKGE